VTLPGKLHHFIVQQASSEAPLIDALLQLKTLCFLPIACQIMLDNHARN